jgi:hypothetical protein
MPRTIRSRNVDLIRWLNYGHENTAKKLATVTNANYLSKMATGDMEIGEWEARSIEKTLGFPVGWLDRDNVTLMMMTSTDFELHRLLVNYPEDAKAGLVKFLMPGLQQQEK